MADADLDAVEEGLRVHAEEDRPKRKRHQHDHFPEGEVLEVLDEILDERAKENALHHPKHVDGGDDDSGGSEDRVPDVDLRGPNHGQHLSNETVESGNPDRGKREENEEDCELRHGVNNPSVLDDFLRVGAFVDHAHREEERPRDERVVDHLDPASGDADFVERKEAEHDVTHVRNRGVGDEPLDLLLHHGHEATVKNSAKCEDHHHRGKVIHRCWKDGHGKAQKTVRAKFQQHRCQLH